jgi:imidazolonepropionase-like amidohydrolase
VLTRAAAGRAPPGRPHERVRDADPRPALGRERIERLGHLHRRGFERRDQTADLVVLDADPAHDVTAFARVARVIRNGRIIYEKAR